MKRYDEKILNMLLDKYENSLLYSGKNQVNIRITVPVQKSVFPEYFDETSTQYDVIHDQLEALEEKGYIRLVWKNKKRGHILEKCELITEQAQAAYDYLHRRPKAGKEQRIRDICAEWHGRAEELDRFLTWVEERMDAGESVRKYVNQEAPEEFYGLCELTWRILTNTEECFLRDFSIQYFHDSKIAEKEIERAVSVISHFSDSDELQDLDTTEILEEYNIYRNPSWIMLKGIGCFQMQGADSMVSTIYLSTMPGGIGIANGDIDDIRWSQELKPDIILTIENLTSFHQWRQVSLDGKSVLCIYLGGYHNHTKRRFLKELFRAYPQASYYHFGDMDCGGFRIWKDLCVKTEIPFKTFRMDMETYRQYQKLGRDLTAQDKKFLAAMREDAFFAEQKEVFDLMLEKGKKIEQECIKFALG